MDRLVAMHEVLRAVGAVSRRGSDYDNWDLEVRGGFWGAARMRLVAEEHGAGKQMLRFRTWPRVSVKVLVLAGVAMVLAVAAAFDAAWFVVAFFALAGLGVAFAAANDAARAMGELAGALSAAVSDGTADVASTPKAPGSESRQAEAA